MILNTGDIPNLYDNEERLEIIEKVRLPFTCMDPEGGDRGSDTPPPPPPSLKHHKNLGFLSNTGPDPMKNHKATKPDSM